MLLQARKTGEAACAATPLMASATGAQKDRALCAMAEQLDANRAQVRAANEADMTRAAASGVAENLVKRLSFGEAKLEARIRCLEKIAKLPDPVGEVAEEWTCENGMRAQRVRVPLGVILLVYEARPHVTVNAGAFCLKAGNACVLRGGSEAAQCNRVLGELWRKALNAAELPADAVQVVTGSHEEVGALLEQEDLIDLVIPRGGERLIRAVSEQSRIPVLKHFAGVCHVYIDGSADYDGAVAIALDSKCLMPEVCNAAETLLVDAAWESRLPDLVDALRRHDVGVKGCATTRRLAQGVEAADERDWQTEYLDLVYAMRVVNGVDEAVGHINTYGSHHTDAIVAQDPKAAAKFLARVDSGVVLHNASTMFCDGESLGMGAEIGISTDKLHARGPMGLRELTSYKFVLRGDGHTMGGFPKP